jgi:hypothetical protein
MVEMTSTSLSQSSAQNRTIKAAVVRKKGGPFTIEKLAVETPRADGVLVRIVATGMCHTDIVIRDQVYPGPRGAELHVVRTLRALRGGPAGLLRQRPSAVLWRCARGRHDRDATIAQLRCTTIFLASPRSALMRSRMSARWSKCQRTRRWNGSDRSAAAFRPARVR